MGKIRKIKKFIHDFEQIFNYPEPWLAINITSWLLYFYAPPEYLKTSILLLIIAVISAHEQRYIEKKNKKQ